MFTALGNYAKYVFEPKSIFDFIVSFSSIIVKFVCITVIYPGDEMLFG